MGFPSLPFDALQNLELDRLAGLKAVSILGHVRLQREGRPEGRPCWLSW